MSDKNFGNGNVVDFSSFRQKKATEEHFARGRTPLYVSHKEGTVKGSPHLKRPDADDFGDRLQRIKTSLEKINSLMSDLKKSVHKRDQDH